ncbi:MAG: F0F1 ATP synthase subunit A [Bacteroidota bacterium]
MIFRIFKENILSIRAIVLLVSFTLIFNSFAMASESSDNSEGGEPFNPGDMIMHHILDSHVWHISDGFTIHLPIIVYSSERGLEVFSSSNFFDEHHNTIEYNGYKLEHEHITLAGSDHVYDLSITKNVAALFMNAIFMLLVFTAVARGFKKNEGKAPSGIQSFFEPIVIYIRDEVIKPNIGHGYEKYVPYLLTLFFFIWFGNLFGLTPGAANLTGNIAVTATLAIFTFLITNFSGNANYWKHIFWTPGVPLPLRIIIFPVELIGVFSKPISLMIRLFVAITAGHIVILSLIGLTFIFQSYAVGIGGAIIIVIINLIEILVATIQAYVFTMFTAVYIGLATEEAH